MLDWDKDPPEPIIQGGQMVMHGAGSKSVRKAIETYKPMLGLHGHIHEVPIGCKDRAHNLCKSR